MRFPPATHRFKVFFDDLGLVGLPNPRLGEELVRGSECPRSRVLPSFLFDFRRSFEYLSLGIAGAFGVTPPPNSRDLAKVLKNVEPHYGAAAKLMRLKVAEVAKRFSRTLAEDSPRNMVAHHRPVEAGDMRVFLDSGLEPRIGLDGGGEDLPIRDVPSEPGARLATVLDHQLTALANAVFELLELLPRPAAGR